MLKIYHAPMTRSCRVIWLFEELGLPYELENISFDASFRNSPEWLAKNPVAKVPVMEDDDLVMFESGAMVQVVLDRYGEGRLQPSPGSAEHAIYLQWLWFAEATFARPLGEIVNHRREFKPEIQEVVAEMKGRARQCVVAINDALVDKEYIIGDFSAADIMLGYTLALCEAFAPWENCPEVDQYWQRIKNRPAAIKALADFSR